jgi:hypothetical protein
VSPGKRDRLPLGAILLAQDEEGRAFRSGDALVIERTFGGKRVETRLPLELEWLWSWMELVTSACDQLAVLSER